MQQDTGSFRETMTTKILLVEDEVIVAMGLERSLRLFGYEVIGIATSGEEAIDLALKKNPDVILMDIHIEGNIDGIEAAEEIGKHSTIPVIYLTAYTNDETLARAIKTNPYGYLNKPVKPREIYTTIETMLHKHRAVEAERELRKSEDRYQQLFSTMTNGFALHKIICDADGNAVDFQYLEVNPAYEKLYGMTSAELVGHTVLEVRPHDPKDAIERCGAIVSTGKPDEFEVYVEDVEKYFDIYAFSPDKIYFASIVTDITDIVQLRNDQKENLEQIEKNLEQLAILNDEIRNPLALIVGLTDLQGGEYRDQILEQADVIDKLINRLDQRWLESSKIHEFLRTHMGFYNV